MSTSPWNKDRIIGQKRPLQISHIWGIRIRLELEGKTRDLALFNMALDNKLRGCDLVKLKVSDVAYGSSVSSRATVLQQKTGILLAVKTGFRGVDISLRAVISVVIKCMRLLLEICRYLDILLSVITCEKTETLLGCMLR